MMDVRNLAKKDSAPELEMPDHNTRCFEIACNRTPAQLQLVSVLCKADFEIVHNGTPVLINRFPGS